MVFRYLLDLFQSGRYGTALRMAKDHHQSRAKTRRGELDTAHLGGSNNVSGDPDDEKIAQALVEHYLGGHPRVGATEYRRKRFLRVGKRTAPCLARNMAVGNAGQEAAISISQAFESFYR